MKLLCLILYSLHNFPCYMHETVWPSKILKIWLPIVVILGNFLLYGRNWKSDGAIVNGTLKKHISPHILDHLKSMKPPSVLFLQSMQIYFLFTVLEMATAFLTLLIWLFVRMKAIQLHFACASNSLTAGIFTRRILC